MNKGFWYAVSAYGLWGLFPLYWKLLVPIPATQLIGHRIIWSVVILGAIILFTHQWGGFKMAVRQPRAVPSYSLAAALLGINWLVYIWAVNAGHIVETALGYYINPLLSVLIGVIILKERLRPAQWLAVILAAGGVGYLTFMYKSPPWIALTLASTFSIYGLVKKMVPLPSLPGLALETGILFIPALLFLLYADFTGQGAFFHTGLAYDLLMIGGGLVTTVPLLFFAAAARLIPLSLLGMLQYIAPTIQLLIGILVYDESFTFTQFIGFGLVWTALIIFAIEGINNHRHQGTGHLGV